MGHVEDSDDDLRQLGHRSWIEDDLSDSKTQIREEVVTGYTALPQSSVKELRQLVDANPLDGDLKDMLAFVLYSNGKLDAAIEVFKELIALKHNIANQYLYLGNCYFRKGLIQMALIEWQRVLDLNPDESFRQRAKSRIERAKAGVSIAFTGGDE